MNASNLIIDSDPNGPVADAARPSNPLGHSASRVFHVRSLVSAILAATLLCLAPNAQAANDYYGAVLKNNSGITVTYFIRVNNGPWKQQRLYAGQSWAYHFYRPTRAMNVEVAYDCRLNDYRNTFRIQKLKMWGCGAPSFGWLQTFIRVNDGYDLVISG